MSDKHAPGPWTMTVYPPDDYGAEDPCAYIDDGNGKHVAHCLPLSKNNDQLRDANARLIAAAPELLNALQGMLRDHKAVHGVGDLEMQPALFQAHAAIDKATGRFGMTTQHTPMEGRATGLLQAVRSIAAITTCADQDPEAMCAEIQGICRVALAKATGGAA